MRRLQLIQYLLVLVLSAAAISAAESYADEPRNEELRDCKATCGS